MKYPVAIALGFCVWLCLTGSRYIYSPPNGGSDGHLTVTDASITAACGAVKTVATGIGTMTVGDYKIAEDWYQMWQAFSRYNLVPIAGETVVSDSLMMWCTYKGAQSIESLDIYRHATDWYPLDSDDFLCWLPTYGWPPKCSATLVCNIPASAITQAAWVVFTDPTPISIAGQVNAFMLDTQYLCTSGNPPLGRRYVTFATIENVTVSYRPYLIVNTLDAGGMPHRYIIRPGITRAPIGDPSGREMGRTR